MEQKKKAPIPVVRRLIQDAIQRERRGWPPGSDWGAYQPRRPETSPGQKPGLAKR